jgi:hypothetical protein
VSSLSASLVKFGGAAGHRSQLAIREYAVIFERGVEEVRSVVGLLAHEDHDLSPQSAIVARAGTLAQDISSHCEAVHRRRRNRTFRDGHHTRGCLRHLREH